jgi:hypothetical protein
MNGLDFAEYHLDKDGKRKIRNVGRHLANWKSSKSTTVFIINIERTDKCLKTGKLTLNSTQINLVDVARNEALRVAGVGGTLSINFKNDKLRRLLKERLFNGSDIYMMGMVS